MDRSEVARPEVGTVRHELDGVSFSSGSNLAQFGDAADLGHAGLGDVDRALLEHVDEIVQPGRVLAGGDRRCAGIAYARKPGVILRWPNGLLKPVQAAWSQRALHLQRLGNTPRAIDIVHERDI